MPRDEFLCEKCKKVFEVTMTIAERGTAKVRCPTCKGTKIAPQLGPSTRRHPGRADAG